MNRPEGFEKLNGEKFEFMIGLTDYKFKIEVATGGHRYPGKNPNRVWIFEDGTNKFTMCAYIDFDWNYNQYHVHRVKIGAGSNGEFLHGRSIKARQIMSMKDCINNLLASETEWLVINNKL